MRDPKDQGTQQLATLPKPSGSWERRLAQKRLAFRLSVVVDLYCMYIYRYLYIYIYVYTYTYHYRSEKAKAITSTATGVIGSGLEGGGEGSEPTSDPKQAQTAADLNLMVVGSPPYPTQAQPVSGAPNSAK